MWRLPWITEDDLVREKAREIALRQIVYLEEVIRSAFDDLESNNEASAHLILKEAVKNIDGYTCS
jgi:hypothetical protein